MFKTDADETKILVEKLLDENERRSMNLFRLILSGFAPFAFSDGKEFIIMQICETTPIWAWFGADISDAAAENAADIIADRVSKCADVQFNADPNRAKKALAILKNKHGISAEKRMAMTAYVCRKPVVPAAKGEMTNPTAEDKQTVADLLTQLVEDGEHSTVPVEGALRFAESVVGSKRVFLWKDGGMIRAMAVVAYEDEKTARINTVVTERESRGNGYAGMLVSRMCENLLAKGVEPMLYADAENPSSNRAYIKTGFEKVGDVTEYSLEKI